MTIVLRKCEEVLCLKANRFPIQKNININGMAPFIVFFIEEH